MFSFTRLLLLSLPLASSVLAQSLPEPSSEQELDGSQTFQELLNALPEESLHAALHEHMQPMFQDGVYEHDRNAVERVHQDNPPLASRVLSAAKINLVRRQNGTVPTTSASPTVVVPVIVSSTNSQGSVVVSTTSAIASVSASVEVPITTTNRAGSTIVSTSTAPAVIVSSTNSAGSVIVTTSAAATYVAPSASDVTTTDASGATVILSDVVPGKVLTTTNARGSTLVTTYTPDGGAVSSLVLQTTVLPDGSRSTITSFAFVAPGTPTGSAGASASNTRNPSLQSQGAAPTRHSGMGKEAVALVAGAVGVAWYL